MPYPRTDCPVCVRDVAVYPKCHKVSRHDPAEGRTPDLKSCPGSFARCQPQTGEPATGDIQEELF